MPMKRVAIIGTQGVPANYGGFETLVENIIGENCSADVQYSVFCSSKDMPTKIGEYRGARLKYVPLRANGVQSNGRAAAGRGALDQCARPDLLGKLQKAGLESGGVGCRSGVGGDGRNRG